MLITILATIVVLGVLIFVHELGHFVTAKLVDIEVPRFSIGLGPKLWGFRWGETEYVISWLPLGGYVRMAGMEELETIEGGPSEEDKARGEDGTVTDAGLVAGERDAGRRRDFPSKSLPARALVLSAGVLMNALFAVVAFAATAFLWGVPLEPEPRIANVIERQLPEGTEALADVPAGARVVSVGGDRVERWSDVERALITQPPGRVVFRFADAEPVAVRLPEVAEGRAQLFLALEPTIEPIVGDVFEGSPAAEAGLRPGDRIVAVAGEEIATWHELVRRIRQRPGERVELLVDRDGRAVAVPITPAAARIGEAGEEETIGRIGISLPRNQPGALASLGRGAAETLRWTTIIVDTLVDLFVGDLSPRSLGGPIMIGQLSGEFARAGAPAFMTWMALLSINLAILNLLPIPILDGGQLVLLGIEGVRGRALAVEHRIRLAQIGAMVVVAIMVWVIISDVLRVFGL